MISRQIVIVDTVGELSGLHPAFPARFPFVKEWTGFEMGSTRGTIPHPHGAMAAEKALQPCWGHDNTEDVEYAVAFIRIFNAQAFFVQATMRNWIWHILRDLADNSDEMYVNNSWGGYVGRRGANQDERAEASKWRDSTERTGATIIWAAGNSGDYLPIDDNDMPQTILTDVNHKAASMRKDGRTSEFSSDSTLGPPVGTMWAEDVMLYNGVRNVWDRGSGTSFAAPKLCGLAAAMGLSYAGLKLLAKSGNSGWNKFERPVRYQGPLPHPKWGYGQGETHYQELIEGSPYLWEENEGAGSTADIGLRSAPRTWFGYRLVAS